MTNGMPDNKLKEIKKCDLLRIARHYARKGKITRMLACKSSAGQPFREARRVSRTDDLIVFSMAEAISADDVRHDGRNMSDAVILLANLNLFGEIVGWHLIVKINMNTGRRADDPCNFIIDTCDGHIADVGVVGPEQDGGSRNSRKELVAACGMLEEIRLPSCRARPATVRAVRKNRKGEHHEKTQL